MNVTKRNEVTKKWKSARESFHKTEQRDQ
jgi:hypothetical protein